MKKSKSALEKGFLKLMNMAVFKKNLEIMRNQIDIKIVTTEARGNYLILERNYHTTNIFGKILGKTNEKKQVCLNQSV